MNFEYEGKTYEMDEDIARKEDKVILPDGKILSIDWGCACSGVSFEYIADVPKNTTPAEAAESMGYALAAILI